MWLTSLNLVALFFVFTSPCGFFSLRRDFAYPVQQVSIPSLPCPDREKSQVKDSPQVANVEQSTSQTPETSEISTVPKPPETSRSPETSLVTPEISKAVSPAQPMAAPAVLGHHDVCSLVVEPCHVDGSGAVAAQTFGDIYMRNKWLGGFLHNIFLDRFTPGGNGCFQK